MNMSIASLFTSENLALRNVVARGHAGSYCLDDKREYVEKYKVKAEPPCFEP